jgi:DNA-binding ferritin-like protein
LARDNEHGGSDHGQGRPQQRPHRASTSASARRTGRRSPAASSKLLADTYTLYLTTHNFHWNVTGPMFNTLHLMFMGQYTELWNAVDPVAERSARSASGPGSYAQFGRLSSIKDAPETPPAALDMVRILVEGHEAVAPHRARHLPARREGRRRARPPTC